MTEMNDGGTAFPCQLYDHLEGVGQVVRDSYSGMSLRDWFAGQAIAGIMGNVSQDGSTFEQSAKEAYRQADAMLAERDKQTGEKDE